MMLRKELLDDVRAAPIKKVCSASGHALKVAGAGRAAFKRADGKPIVLHHVLLVSDLKANLISLCKLTKAGHATVARNRVLTKVGDDSFVPLERWLGRKLPVDIQGVFGCMAVAHVPKKYRSKLGASAIWCVHLGLAAESKGWLLWEPRKGMLFDSRDEGLIYGGWKKQPEAKVLHEMEQITMQLDLTPRVWEEGEETAAEGGDGEKVQEAPAGGGGSVEASCSTSRATGPEAEFKHLKAAEDEGVEAEEQQQFQSLVGSLLYAAVHTRPDISFSVGQLARVVENPSEEQVDAPECVVKYQNSHPSIGVQYSASAQVKQKGVEVLKEKGCRLGEGKLFLTCFTDATWASEKDDSSSVGGYICGRRTC
ncbi:unnamed protein product [Closterium sp. NIES-54]